jgi:hypothetical protein
MSKATVQVRELGCWGLDDYAHRPPSAYARAETLDLDLRAYAPQLVFMETGSVVLQDALQPHATRPDLVHEMMGLDWFLGVIDLRCLIAFQRRVFFNPRAPQRSIPQGSDWPGLIDFCFPRSTPIVCDLVRKEGNAIIMQSANPNLQLRMWNTTDPLQVYSGSPFFEVAQYRERWFLRDGYHRAYALLKAGVSRVPAVVVRAKNLAEVGAVRPWFFTEETLFSSRPPRIVDFLNDRHTIQYNLPPLIKTLRVTIEESLAPEPFTGEQQ